MFNLLITNGNNDEYWPKSELIKFDYWMDQLQEFYIQTGVLDLDN